MVSTISHGEKNYSDLAREPNSSSRGSSAMQMSARGVWKLMEMPVAK